MHRYLQQFCTPQYRTPAVMHGPAGIKSHMHLCLCRWPCSCCRGLCLGLSDLLYGSSRPYAPPVVHTTALTICMRKRCCTDAVE